MGLLKCALIALSLGLVTCTPVAAQTETACDATAPTGEGRQHLALIIGVGDYSAPHIPDLGGTLNDAAAMRDFLTDENGPHGLAPENVCMLTEERATLDGVLSTMRTFLIDRVDNQDHVTFFYAGHGGQIADASPGAGESDRMDETFVLQDSETTLADGSGQDVPHMSDDVFGALLETLNDKLTTGRRGAHALTVILDSCNSLSATRGDKLTTRYHESASRYSGANARSFRSTQQYLSRAGFSALSVNLENRTESIAQILPEGAVIMVAAGDGKVAHERMDFPSGVFTSALLQEMALATKPLTYAELEWRVRSAMRSDYQIPAFHGAMGAYMFDTETRYSGASHRVSHVEEDTVQLIGIPLLGAGVGAEFRIFDGDAGTVTDPSAAKAVVTIDQSTTINLKGTVSAIDTNAIINAGDLAVLMTPAASQRVLRVLIDDVAHADLISAVIQNNDELKRGVVITQDASHFDLSLQALANGGVSIVDVNGEARKSFKTGPELADNIATQLGKFARQKNLKTLRGDGGGVLVDDRTIKVSLVAHDTSSGEKTCVPMPRGAGQDLRVVSPHRFEVPIGQRYCFAVTALARDIDRELSIGVLFLSSDGEIYSIPHVRSNDDAVQSLRLSPPNQRLAERGQLSFVIPDVYKSNPPAGAEDEVIVFAVDSKTPVPWWSFAGGLTRRSSVASESRLHREVNSLLTHGTRSGGPDNGEEDPLSLWTMTKISIKVVEPRE